MDDLFGESVICVPYAGDPLARVARDIIATHRDVLPDLTRVVVLVPQPHIIPRLRRLLLTEAAAAGIPALLGPDVDTLRGWVERHPMSGEKRISQVARELMLVEALGDHPDLFNHGNPWAVAECLLALFDELTIHHVRVPTQIATFTANLGRAYGLPDATVEALGREARLVHTLWQAWHRQLEDEGLSDPNVAYNRKLALSLQQFPRDHFLYLVGPTRLAPAERAWLSGLMQQRQATVVIHGQAGRSDYHPEGALHHLWTFLGGGTAPASTRPLTRLLDAVFDNGEVAMATRAREFAQQCPESPASGHLGIVCSGGAEHEARAVELQVRRWLLAGERDIGIVTDDRRLARRLRALLERAGVHLQDKAGWALSTTSAASALEYWLQAVEEDFAYRPLLDLLKTPFVTIGDDRGAHLAAVYRLEQDIIRHENVPRGLARYRQHVIYRRERLPQNLTADSDEVIRLLDHLADAAKPLILLLGNSAPRPPETYLDALLASLQQLGIFESLLNDSAGSRILQELRLMRHALEHNRLQMTWLEFRGWLGRTLERFNFTPAMPSGQAQVQLLSIDQSALQRFDALILCGLTRDNLPGVGESSPFFNGAVRRELGLPDQLQRMTERFYHFRRLLEAAPKVLLSLHRGEDGDALPCPWLDAIQSFHRLAYGDALDDPVLAAWASHPDAEVLRCDTPDTPTSTTSPRPAMDPALFPQTISASSHQMLIDCPYQFFAAASLRLQPPETIREALGKSDYGERVHRCLEAFHGGVRGLPGPFTQLITSQTRSAAIQCLEDIARAEFAEDLEDNFLHRGWLKRWLQLIPAYVDWQLERNQAWQVAKVEVEARKTFAGATLKGRLDRIDRGEQGLGIIDYKTGHTPDQDEVDHGEAVQLTHYAMTATEDVQRVEYLRLDKYAFGTRAVLEGSDLRDMMAETETRLQELVTSARQSVPFPAWGDEDTCRYCSLAGVCRKQSWEV